MDEKEQEPENSRGSTGTTTAVETVIVIGTEEKGSNSAASLAGECDDVATPNPKVVEEMGLSQVSSPCVIDVNCGSVVASKSLGEDWEFESVCRICHLSSDQSPERRTNSSATSVSDLIHLGCVCKDDLGVAHYQCAEAWFKLKGNRVCEICGEAAKNVAGVGDIGFMEEWNEMDNNNNNNNNNSPEMNRVCWRGQPFCNFLMACLVIAFVLPWFFRVNMF